MTTTNPEEPDLLNVVPVGADRWMNRTPEQKAIDRANAMKRLIKGRPLPEGKTLEEVVSGTWPGDETDEQIKEALERLS